MHRLLIQHIGGSDPAAFQLVRAGDEPKSVGPIELPSPIGFPVQGRPNSELMAELRWYLEIFLDHPFHPYTDRAERILAALKSWGTQAFDTLLGHRSAGRLFEAATSEDYAQLNLEVVSDDPTILYWPWEALEDSEVGVLARTCQIQRRLSRIRDPHPLSEKLPRDTINILLVTARPYEGDVRFRSISRPMIELIDSEGLPANITLLRPPTFDQLRSHLREHPEQYHILHFDGHGSYGQHSGTIDPHLLTLQGKEGQLIFENDQGKPDPKTATVLSELLREHKIPIVVLNACQSAMVDEAAEDAFASVAAGLQKSGVRSVVAMAYSLYVSSAQQFLPAFYRRLFESGSIADATRAGRQQAFAHKQRVCARGTFPLEDWLVPVLYEQQSIDLSFAATAKPTQATERPIPAEAQDSNNPYGLIGRDGSLLELERAMHRPPSGILIQGLGGIGKTTLARGFIKWLEVTGGLGNGCFWFSFQDIRSAEAVINEMVGALLGTHALALPLQQKTEALRKALQDNPFLIVWDNFEVASGIEGTSVDATLSPADRQRLLGFLQALRGGRTKVLITSRSGEHWIDPLTCYRLQIGGLRGEERWEYCERVVADLGLSVDRSDETWSRLVDTLDGHPLAMRVLLPQLQGTTPKQLHEAIGANLLQFESHDEDSAKLFATLRFVQDGLPAELHRLLVTLAMHEQYVDAEDLVAMGQTASPPVTQSEVDRLLSTSVVAGVLQAHGGGIHELHPALSRYLQLTILDHTDAQQRDFWWKRFIDRMGSIADACAGKELHEQRVVFRRFGASFRRALREAERLECDVDFSALTQSLAAYAQNTRNFSEAEALSTALADHHRRLGQADGEAAGYHRLGIIAEDQRNFATAEQWYRKSLAIFEKLGNERGATATYHQLGIIAQEQRDFATAEQWYRKSLAIEEKQGNEHGAAQTYHQLGRIAEEQRDFATAEQWCRKSLAIFEKQGNKYAAATTYHQLGIIAEDQRNFATAEQWYRKSLAIFEKQGNEHAAATTYHQLGIIAQEQRDFATAEQWFRMSLAIREKQGNEHGAAQTYHQLGRIAEEQRDFATAEQWYRKSLAIKEKQGNEYGAGTTYYQLGRLAEEQGSPLDAGKLYIRAMRGLAGDQHTLGIVLRGFQRIYKAADERTQETLQRHWDQAGLGQLPELE